MSTKLSSNYISLYIPRHAFVLIKFNATNHLLPRTLMNLQLTAGRSTTVDVKITAR